MPEFLFIFGYETPRERRINDLFGKEDERSMGILIIATDAGAALNWGNKIAQRYVALLYGVPEVDWGRDGYGSWIENDRDRTTRVCLRVDVGEYPDFNDWLAADRE